MIRGIDDPDLTPIQFLYAVLRDRALNLTYRTAAAERLIHLGLANYARQPEVHIRVTGGLQPQPQFSDFSDELKRDLAWISRCYDHGIEDPDIDNWNTNAKRPQ
jgi:hypothetical protein